jgi:hypothetical protein
LAAASTAFIGSEVALDPPLGVPPPLAEPEVLDVSPHPVQIRLAPTITNAVLSVFFMESIFSQILVSPDHEQISARLQRTDMTTVQPLPVTRHS